MKALKLSLIIVSVALATYGLSGTAFAFHDGGVAGCDGCHTMHNSTNNPMLRVTNPNGGSGEGNGNTYLLQGVDQSSTCLNCHAAADALGSGGSYHVMTYPFPATGVPPSELSPGGDFAWLQKSYAAAGYGNPSPGYFHGHNIIAAGYGLTADPRNAVAPGALNAGSAYPGNELFCSSCHDPHGKYRLNTVGQAVHATTGAPIYTSGSYGNDPSVQGTQQLAVGAYRLLGGVGYSPVSVGGAGGPYAFTADSPWAAAPSTYNRSEATSQTVVAYGKGVSAWCSNCHPLMHTASNNTGGNVHPTGQAVGAATAVNYNGYIKTGTFSTGANLYSTLAPFGIDNIQSNSTLSTNINNQHLAMQSSSQVVCYTCHRAHASGWDEGMRFPIANDFMTIGDGAGHAIYPGSDTTGSSLSMNRTNSEWQQALYGRPATVFAPYQRPLCNKCHIKD